MPQLLAILGAYVVGGMPWSVWLCRWRYGVDPRTIADGNPGAANTLRVAGRQLGLMVFALDFLKACVPIGLVYWLGNWDAVSLWAIGLAPTLGHAFSPFLRLRGGRALLTMFGVWTGFTLYEVPLVMGGAAVAGLFLTDNDETRSFLVPLSAVVYLAITGAEVWMVGVAMGQVLVLFSKISVYLWTQHTEQAHVA